MKILKRSILSSFWCPSLPEFELSIGQVDYLAYWWHNSLVSSNSQFSTARTPNGIKFSLPIHHYCPSVWMSSSLLHLLCLYQSLLSESLHRSQKVPLDVVCMTFDLGKVNYSLVCFSVQYQVAFAILICAWLCAPRCSQKCLLSSSSTSSFRSWL